MKAITGRNAFEVLTFERFTFWATLMAMPIVGELSEEIIERYRRKGAATLWVGAVLTISIALAWMALRPITTSPFKVDEVISFLNRDGHDKFRYLTLGFGNQFSKVATYTTASSVDGDYNSARLLPELTQSGIGQLYNAKYFGAYGMEALRAMLKHANQYGLKYIFVRDRYYEPLLAFAGWRQIESYDNGNVELWSKDDVPPAHPHPIHSRAHAHPGRSLGLVAGCDQLVRAVPGAVVAGAPRTERVEVVEFPSARESVLPGGELMNRVIPVAMAILLVVLVAMASVSPSKSARRARLNRGPLVLRASEEPELVERVLATCRPPAIPIRASLQRELGGKDGSLRTIRPCKRSRPKYCVKTMAKRSSVPNLQWSTAVGAI